MVWIVRFVLQVPGVEELQYGWLYGEWWVCVASSGGTSTLVTIRSMVRSFPTTFLAAPTTISGLEKLLVMEFYRCSGLRLFLLPMLQPFSQQVWNRLLLLLLQRLQLHCRLLHHDQQNRRPLLCLLPHYQLQMMGRRQDPQQTCQRNPRRQCVRGGGPKVEGEFHCFCCAANECAVLPFDYVPSSGFDAVDLHCYPGCL